MLEDATFNMNCPHCGKEVTVRADQVGTTITCEHCKNKIELKDNGFKNKLKDVEDQLNHLLDGFK